MVSSSSQSAHSSYPLHTSSLNVYCCEDLIKDRRVSMDKRLKLNNFPPLPSSSLCLAPPSHTWLLPVIYKETSSEKQSHRHHSVPACTVPQRHVTAPQADGVVHMITTLVLPLWLTPTQAGWYVWQSHGLSNAPDTTFSFPLFLCAPLPAQHLQNKCQNLSVLWLNILLQQKVRAQMHLQNFHFFNPSTVQF